MSTDAISEEKMKVHRGERYVHDIHIETHARSSGKLKAVDHTIVLFHSDIKLGRSALLLVF